MNERNARGLELYHRYAAFMADDLSHIAEEETELLSILHGAFSAAELHAIEGRIVSAIPPEKMSVALRLMMPALNHPEH